MAHPHAGCGPLSCGILLKDLQELLCIRYRIVLKHRGTRNDHVRACIENSSAAALPLNVKTTTEELGVDEKIASFVLPLGMTINMNGTAIMQVVATLFIAGCAGYDVTLSQLIVIALLALIASAGTPAAPGAGAIILFTILSGLGYINDGALLAYSLILAINRPIEMLVTALNVVGDSATAIYVAKSEGMLNEDIYNS